MVICRQDTPTLGRGGTSLTTLKEHLVIVYRTLGDDPGGAAARNDGGGGGEGKADTLAFDAQFSATTSAHTVARDTHHTQPIEYNIPERAEVVRLACSPGDGLSDREKLRRRIQAIEARAALCYRRETQRRGRPKSTAKQEESEDAVKESEEDAKDEFPMVCRSTQCLFCLGDEGLPYLHRVYEYAKPNKMMNEVEKHLERFAPEDQVPCPHPQCKAAELILPSVMVFKNHTAKVHKVLLRP